MPNAPDFDLQAAHRYFSAACFNRAWELIDQPNRTPAENEEMLRLSLASAWHWSQRPDCAPANLSIGTWQTARIYTLLGQVENARRYGQLCLEISRGAEISPFYLGYAYEALARVEALAGDKKKMEQYLNEALRAAAGLTDLEDKEQLIADLETIH